MPTISGRFADEGADPVSLIERIDTGAGEDEVDVEASAFDRFFAQLGDDNDRLTVRANLVRLETALNGGAGAADRLLNEGNDFRGAFSTSGFEL